jgi:predicted glycosyltransferase
VSRAGANALYELLALGKPNLLIPLSPRVSRGDQVENAELARATGFQPGAAEDALDAERLAAEVRAPTGSVGSAPALAGVSGAGRRDRHRRGASGGAKPGGTPASVVT